ncbi:MAG: tetratricopeptide repeat protein [Thermoguttaceae bacterium]|jgi:tetratricopeptide (TPR) repeat protein|nr:tetratricopeptide repeat protein [Thermoguttaceae bacterium]
MNAEGVRLFEQARFTEAMDRFERAIAADPTAGDGYYNLAATYHRVGAANGRKADLIQAERYYYLCLDRSPDHRECHRGLAVLLAEQGRSEEAFRLLESWAAKNPALPDPKIELARLSEEFGDRDAAKQYLADALLRDPTNARALAALGRLRELEGDTVQALANYQQSLLADRFQPDISARVAMLQSAAGTPPVSGGASSGTRIVTRSPGAFR